MSTESSAESSRDAPVPILQSTAIPKPIRTGQGVDEQKQNLSASQENLQLREPNDQVTVTVTKTKVRSAAGKPTKHSTPVQENFDANLVTASTISGHKRRTTDDFETSTSRTGARSKTTEISLNAERSTQIVTRSMSLSASTVSGTEFFV